VCLLSAQEKNATRVTPIPCPPPIAQHRVIATLITHTLATTLLFIPVAALLLTHEALIIAPHAVLCR
jgi:hypothetical protein